MELRLRVLGGKSANQEIAVKGPQFFIGRAEDCHLRPNSELVSRHHCVLSCEEGYISVRDFGSKNGTYVNEERVGGERELRSGDCLAVGPLKFEVILNTGIGTKKRGPVNDVADVVARTAQAPAQGNSIDEWLSEPAESQAAHPTKMMEFNADEASSDHPTDPAHPAPSSVQTTMMATPSPEEATPGKPAPRVVPPSKRIPKVPPKNNTLTLDQIRRHR